MGAEVAVVFGADAPVDFGAPKRPVPEGAAAGVLEGAAEVVPPRGGKRDDDCVVPVDVEGWLVAGLAADSVPVAGVLKSEDV